MTTTVERPIRILLVDDHEVVRFGLRMLIESQPGLQVVSEATSRAMTIDEAAREQPDIILLDLDLGTESGLELIPDLRKVAANAQIIVLTGVREQSVHQRAVRLGVAGLVLKEHSPMALIQAIKHVFAGQAWLDTGLVANVLSEIARGISAEQGDPEVAKIAALTEREREVITLICEGLQNKIIAQRLSISDTTVRHHLTSIFAKLEIENRLELVIYAYRHGLASMPQ